MDKYKYNMKKFNLEISKQKTAIYPYIIHSKRNFGIDILRIIAMINIINLHINAAIKFSILKPNHPKYIQLNLLETFSFWAVDAYGLISGLIGYKKYKIINMIYIYFECSFYSIIYSLYLYFDNRINFRDFILFIFPFGNRTNWYANAYIFMYLFLPFITDSINILVNFFIVK